MRGIDRYGATERETDKRFLRLTQEVFVGATLVDLADVDVSCVPSPSIDGRHEWYAPGGTLRVTEFSHGIERIGDGFALIAYLASEGVHRVYALLAYQSELLLMVKTFRPPSDEYFRTALRPAPWKSWLEPPVDPAMFPHECPACGRPAYIGLNLIECSGARCRGR